MSKKIVLITGNKGFFGQTRKAWNSMDAALIKARLDECNYEICEYTHHEVANLKTPIENAIIFYSFSQKSNIRAFLKDLIRYLDNGTNFIIPSYDLLKCHEDKGYQELYKKRLCIVGLRGYYFTCFDDLFDYSLDFPLVLKPTKGSNAKGVKLLHSKEDLIKEATKLQMITFKDKIDLFRRKYLRPKKNYPEYPNYSNRNDLIEYIPYIRKEQNFILQEYIPNLDFDFRVLVFHDKYFVMKRHAQKGDFRASGTKYFDFDFDIDEKLLEYAKEIHEKIDNPFLSMDICPYKDGYAILEFQASHFGISAFMKSKHYYRFANNQWQRFPASSVIEYEIADALIKYIEQRPEN